MLTGKTVRVRFARNHVVPCYLDTADAEWQEVAARLLDIFRLNRLRTRGELEEEIRDTFGDSHNQQVFQGLAKLLEDRSEFAVVSGLPPEKVREVVFRLAAEIRKGKGAAEQGSSGAGEQNEPLPAIHFDRGQVLERAASELGVTVDDIERCLYADLRSEQQMVGFKDLTPERLLQRYNVALAQAVLLRATSVQVKIRGESPRRYRQLLRQLKFHRLMCEVEALTEDVYLLKLDGPLSLFSATQKYGLQLALFLPALLLCKEFELEAEVLWGPQKRLKKFRLSSKDGLISHYADSGMYVPAELEMFVELFRKRIHDWEISEATELLSLGNSFWVPDYQLLHKETGQIIYLEVLGFWRRSSVEKHLERLRQHAPAPFVLAVSDGLHIEDEDLAGLPASVYRFRQMPLPKEVVKAAEALLHA